MCRLNIRKHGRSDIFFAGPLRCWINRVLQFLFLIFISRYLFRVGLFWRNRRQKKRREDKFFISKIFDCRGPLIRNRPGLLLQTFCISTIRIQKDIRLNTKFGLIRQGPRSDVKQIFQLKPWDRNENDFMNSYLVENR